jgi:trehalose/maltose transport system substrate-binding protein
VRLQAIEEEKPLNLKRLSAWLQALVLSSAMLGVAPVGAAELTISCGAIGVELALCRTAAEDWAAKTGNRVAVVSAPSSSSERLALFQQLLAAGADDIDVFQIDVVWPGLLASHLIDLRPYVGDAPAAHFPAIVANDTVDGRLVAMPWFASVGVLYYRKDLLDKHGEPVPETWEALTASAERIQAAERAAGNEGLWGFVWQGRAYEGLTCNALEWVASSGGGTLVDAKGKVTIDNPRAAEAIDRAAGWVGTISPQGVLNYAEEEARGLFQSGNALFMRSWPYAWSLAQGEDSPIKGKVGVTAVPKGGPNGRHAAALGGWQLAVSRYSKHPKEAAALVAYLTSLEVQKERAIAGAFNPTIPALYQDPEILKAAPFFATLSATLASAVARPSAVTGGKYNQVSSAFWNAVHGVLSGREKAGAGLKRLQGRLDRLSRGGRAW